MYSRKESNGQVVFTNHASEDVAEVGERNLRKLMEARGEEAQQVRKQARQAAIDLLRREDLID